MRQILLEGRLLHIFPCRADKRPCTPHGHLDAVSDAAGVAELWARYPGPLVGVATGAIGGIAVIDIDPDGESWFHSHRDQLPQTRTHSTRREGWHLIYSNRPGLRCSIGKVARGVDIKAEGGFVVWWPAALGRVLCEGPVAPFPAWVHEAVCTPSNGTPHRIENGGMVSSDGRSENGSIPKPLYFEVLCLVPLSPLVTRRHQRWVISILHDVTTLHRGRNPAINKAGFDFRPLVAAGVVTRDAAERLLFGAAQCCGYVAKDGAAAAMATIRSGLGPTSPNRRGHPPIEANQ